MDMWQRSAAILAVLGLALAGCGGGGGGSSSPPPFVPAKVVKIEYPPIFNGGTTFSRSANPGVTFFHLTITVADLHVNNPNQVSASIGGVPITVQGAGGSAHNVDCQVWSPGMPDGTYPVIVTEHIGGILYEAEQTNPPLTITFAP